MSNYYNVGAQYEIIGRVTNGTAVQSYILLNRITKMVGAVEKSIVEQLALNKQIYNCKAQVYNNIVNLKGINCKLNQLPRYDNNCKLIFSENTKVKKRQADLQLVGKIRHGRAITEYIAVRIDEPDKMIKISREQTLQLAKQGRFINAKSQMDGSEIVLRAVPGYRLSQLKTYDM